MHCVRTDLESELIVDRVSPAYIASLYVQAYLYILTESIASPFDRFGSVHGIDKLLGGTIIFLPYTTYEMIGQVIKVRLIRELTQVVGLH